VRFVVVGSSHYTEVALSAIRRADPYAIIYFVERSSEVAETIASRHKATPVSGDLLESSTYRRAEIEKADVFVAVSDSDALNIKLARMAREVYDIPKVIVWLNNPLNLKALEGDPRVRAITLQEHFESLLLAELSTDAWVVFPLPQSLGVAVAMYRFGKFAHRDLTPARVRMELQDHSVMVVFYNSFGSAIENENKVLSGGDYLAIAGEASEVKSAMRKLDKLFAKTMVSELSAAGVSTPFGVG